ncbi:MAG: PD40 domain-containing protein [Terrimonas sp.]|mgnify:CR=1 FL=1|nr:PD40 domain-containing protein [Terrimonas sp.]OJY92990.1 MAG: flagellar motor protein MotB [Sphingobacteriales bacterium 40-81]
MKHFYIILTNIFLSISFCFGQQYNVEKINKKAITQYNLALDRAQNGEYDKALEFVDKAIQIDARYLDAYLTKAGIYGELRDYENCVANYEKAFALDTEYSKDYKLPYAINLAGLGKFQQALDAVTQFLDNPNLNEPSRKAGEYRKRCFAFAVQYDKDHPAKNYVFAPKNMGDSINTADLEYYPSVTIDDKTLVFTRRVRGYNEDFFVSDRTSGAWTKAKGIDGDLNSNFNEGAQNISQDGEWLIFTGCNFPEGLGSCDLFFSTKTKKGWSAPQNPGQPLNTEFWESSPCLSPDKRELYFSSNRPGGFGGKDIYISRKLPNGRWSEPENLGEKINTIGDESCPFVHADNQTLYFTSNGLTGYGGDDLFLARKQADGSWDKVENLGYPLNTTGNEGSLVVAADGKTAYYASDRADTRGGLDIYTFEMRKDLQPNKTLWVQGTVYDNKTKEGLPSAVELIDIATGQLLSKVQTNESGNYLITLPVGKDYAFNVNRKGYLFYSKNFPFSKNVKDSTYTIDIGLQPIEANASVILNNIFFDVNQFELKPESVAELDKVVQLLVDNPAVKILISGHTDNTGKAADNIKLSEDRAKAVVTYLQSKGIAVTRLQHKGYGASKPIADNNTEEGKMQNRRTELTIVAK